MHNLEKWKLKQTIYVCLPRNVCRSAAPLWLLWFVPTLFLSMLCSLNFSLIYFFNDKLLQNMSHMAGGVEESNCPKGKEIDSSKVMAFSPLEGTLTRERKSGLTNESLKLKRMELSIKTTYALIPALLLISKSMLTTSALVLCVYWQIYGFFKEIFLDYVHHEVTRKWVLIYFKLLLLILAKDTILAFDLV